MAAPSPGDRVLGATTVLFAADGGKYPHGKSLLVRGREETLVIDPSPALIPRCAELPRVDRVVNSHVHEDHVAGNHLFPDAPWHAHEADLPGLRSFAGFLAIFGYDDPAVMRGWAQLVRERFHYTERPDARGFRDGDVLDLGGGVRVRVIHTPGHTRGHSALFIEPDGIRRSDDWRMAHLVAFHAGEYFLILQLGESHFTALQHCLSVLRQFFGCEIMASTMAGSQMSPWAWVAAQTMLCISASVSPAPSERAR